MVRNLLAASAALALLTGAAYAEDSYSTQQTTTTTAAPAPMAPADSYSKTRTERSTDAFGNQSERSDSIQKSQAMTPDGNATTVTHSHSVTGAPANDE